MKFESIHSDISAHGLERPQVTCLHGDVVGIRLCGPYSHRVSARTTGIQDRCRVCADNETGRASLFHQALRNRSLLIDVVTDMVISKLRSNTRHQWIDTYTRPLVGSGMASKSKKLKKEDGWTVADNE
jgi:hypothetical protein